LGGGGPPLAILSRTDVTLTAASGGGVNVVDTERRGGGLVNVSLEPMQRGEDITL
jgi:hypothetical protein